MGAALLAAYGVGLVDAPRVRRGWVDARRRARCPMPRRSRATIGFSTSTRALSRAEIHRCTRCTTRGSRARAGCRAQRGRRAGSLFQPRKERAMNPSVVPSSPAQPSPSPGHPFTSRGAADALPGKDVTINIGYFPVVSPVPIMRAQQQLEDEGLHGQLGADHPGPAGRGERARRRQARHRVGQQHLRGRDLLAVAGRRAVRRPVVHQRQRHRGRDEEHDPERRRTSSARRSSSAA